MAVPRPSQPYKPGRKLWLVKFAFKKQVRNQEYPDVSEVCVPGRQEESIDIQL